MVPRYELECCLLYAKMLKELQCKKIDHQEDIVNLAYLKESYLQKIRICNYIAWGIGLLFVFLLWFICTSSLTLGQGGLISIFLLISLAVVIYIKNKLKCDLIKERNNESSMIEEHCMAINKINGQIADIFEELLDEKLLDVIPLCYFYPSAIEFIISAFDRRLADSMKEAFNLLEAEIQRSQNLRMQRELNESLINEVQQLIHAVNLNTYYNTTKY